MVQEYQSPVRVYKYPFEMVMAAYERRFPRCPQIPVVVECVVTEDSWSRDNSQRHTSRKCQLNVDAPYLLKKMIGVDYVYFIQKNHLDLRARQLSIEATNETFSSRVVVLEKCRYFVHPENPAWTCFEQTALLDVKSFFGFEHAIEKIAMKQYSSNIAKGKEIIDVFMKDVYADGISELGQWREGAGEENEKLREVLCRGVQPTHAEDQDHSSEKESRGCESARGSVCGELTAVQQAKVQQLGNWIAELQKGKVPSDATLVRFLKAREWSVERAREMLSESLVWRKRYRVDRILNEYETPRVVASYFPGGWHRADKDGRPLYILRLGQMDVKGLLKSIGEDGLLKLTLHVCEEGLKLGGESTGGWCLLLDLDGLNMRHLWRPGVRALLRIIQIAEANYPETLGRVLIVRAPRVFPILWTIVSTFIDENTRSKFLFYGGKDYLQSGGLLDYIDQDLIPDFLGGPCENFIHAGGTVPKSEYQSGVFTERTDCDPLSEDTIYRSVTIPKNHIHEVIVHNDDPSSVLTWDFDVMRSDVEFTVFHTELQLPDECDQAVNTCSMGLGGSEEPGRSVLGVTGWKEGSHYSRVEPAILCHDGESVQGSHVMTSRGRYVLQWHWRAARNQTDATHTKLMYFYETLASTDYKGSMWSLQSGNSGFSVLSGKSAVSSCPSR